MLTDGKNLISGISRDLLLSLERDGGDLDSLFLYEEDDIFYTTMLPIEINLYISKEIKEILVRAFDLHMNELFCRDLIETIFAEQIKDRIDLWLPSPDAKKNEIVSMIKERSNELLQVKFENFYHLLNEEEKRSVRLLKENREQFNSLDLERKIMFEAYLKFSTAVLNNAEIFRVLKDRCNGKKIQISSLDIVDFANALYNIHEEQFEGIFKDVLIIKQIKYLQRKFELIEKEEEKADKLDKPSHRHHAIAYWYNEKVGVKGYDRLTCTEVTKKWRAGRRDAFYEIGYFGKKSKQFKPVHAKEIKMALGLLKEPGAIKLAEDDIERMRLGLDTMWSPLAKEKL